MIEHLDEDGNPCTRHAAPDLYALLEWAAVGSRISGFHHDSASKLQSLRMALDEATEALGDDRPDVRVQLDTAMTALRDLHALLTENRALAKPPQRKAVALADLLSRAAARHGVALQGELGSSMVHVAPPSTVHALSMLLDLSAGALQGRRVVSITVTTNDSDVTVSIAGAPLATPAASANKAIAMSTYLLAREDGTLRCAPLGFAVQLPLATSARSAAVKP